MKVSEAIILTVCVAIPVAIVTNTVTLAGAPDIADAQWQTARNVEKALAMPETVRLPETREEFCAAVLETAAIITADDAFFDEPQMGGDLGR